MSVDQKRIIYLDIETNGSASHIWCCCTQEGNDDVRVWQEAGEFLEYIGRDSTIIAHNACHFDIPVLIDCWGLDIDAIDICDTLVLSRLANPIREGGHSLKAWGQRLACYKGDFTDWDGGLSDEMIEYCKQDVRVLKQVHEVLKRELKGFSEQCITLEHEVATIIHEQVRNGFKVDEKQLMLLSAQLSDSVVSLRDQLQDTFDPTVIEMKTKTKVIPFNPGSRQQIADRLMKLGWKPDKKTEKGNIIIDEDVLSKIDIPEAKMLIEYLLVQKRLAQVSSWQENIQKDGRVHGGVITIGAVTGRMSHNSPNMAQIPAARSPYGQECRSVWTVDDGNVLVGADLSGIELRCFAHYLNNADYTNEIVYGDVHTRNQQMFGVATRDLAKTILYASMYGASPSKLAGIIGGNKKDGDRLRDGFNSIPGYTKLAQKLDRMADAGWLPGLDGRKLIVKSKHSALNLLLQGAGAIVFKQWLVVMRQYLNDAQIPYKLVASVHDEVQIETAERHGDDVGKLVVKAAVDAGEQLGMRCPLAAEYKVNTNWHGTH